MAAIFSRQNFQMYFRELNIWIAINISPRFLPNGQINNIPSLVQRVTWRRPGDKPLSEPMMAKFTDAYMRHSTSISQPTNRKLILYHTE